MTEIPKPAEIHQQDEATLKRALGLGEQELIPQPVLDSYYEIRRQKHRIIGGSLAVETILLVIHASKGMDLVPEPEEKEVKAPGTPLETSEGLIQPDVILVGGTEMLIRHNGDWCTAKYMGPGKEDKLRFGMGKKTVQVARADVRFKE
jgi:hypothetical protein